MLHPNATVAATAQIYTKGHQVPRAGNASAVKTSQSGQGGSPPDTQGQVAAFDFHAEPNLASGATVAMYMADGTPYYTSPAIISKIKANGGKAKKGGKRKKARQNMVNQEENHGSHDGPPARNEGGGGVDDVVRGRGRGGPRRGGRPGGGYRAARGADQHAEGRYIGLDGKARTPGQTCSYCKNLGHTEADCHIKKNDAAGLASVSVEWGNGTGYDANEVGRIFGNSNDI